MMDELDFESDELDFDEEIFEETIKELEQARGEVVIQIKKKRSKKSPEIILVFKDTSSMEEDGKYVISIKADNIHFIKNDQGTSHKVKVAEIKDNKFLEYLSYHDDAMNPQLTLAFEKGYSIELSGATNIQELDKI